MDDNDHINNNIEEGGGGGQQDEAQQQQQQQQQHQILLSPEGQLLLSLLESNSKSELPPYVNNTIIQAVNDIAEDFVTKVRTSIVDILFISKVDGPERQNRERGLTKTIVDRDWHKQEKKIEKAIRFFPDVVAEQRYGYYPIQWMASRDSRTEKYNLLSVSLIPIVTKLACDFRQFDEELRGGLLSQYPNHGWNTLQQIICYNPKENENKYLLDDCFSAVRNWMRENNYLLHEDIQQHNLFGKLCTHAGFVSESRVQYFIDWDPVVLSLPCDPENGNFLPMHWSVAREDMHLFSLLLKDGMQYYPEKFGFVFGEGTHEDENGKIYRYTAFEGVCIEFGQEKVMNEVINCITEYCLASTTASTSASNHMETSLLLSAITDDAIHLDAVFILLRKDPITAFLRLQQQLQLLVGDKGHTGTDTSTETGTGTDDANNINNSNNNSDGVSNRNTDTDTTYAFTSTSTTLPSSDTIAAINVSSTTNNSNNDEDTNNNNDVATTNNNRDNVTHEPSLPTGKKRKRKRKRKDEVA